MIVAIFTGGTISMRTDARTGGAVPALSGKEIVAMAPGLDDIARLEVDEWGTFPGPHMTVERMWDLRARIITHLARPEVDGVVVTHGTDTLEETAYLVARSVWSEKPVVFTGAMRTSNELGWDGPANLGASARTAAAPSSRGRGVLVVMSDRIYSALDVAKANANMLDAFGSPEQGATGEIDDGRVRYQRDPDAAPPVIEAPWPAVPVDIIYTWAGADSRLLDASREQARGVVVAAMGRGNVPVAMLPGIDGFIAEGKPVVVTTRTLHGRVGQTYAYEGGGRRLVERGAILAGARRPQQARIDLMLALGAGFSLDAIRAVFGAD